VLRYSKREIEAAKKLKGVTNNDIAAAAGVSAKMVSMVICSDRKSAKVEKEIERLLQPELTEIFHRKAS